MFAQRRSSFPARAMCLTVSTAGVGIAAAPPLIADWVPIAINAFIRLLLRPFLSRFMGSSLSACYEDWPATSKRSWNAQREHQQVSIRSEKPPPLQRDLCRGSPYVIPPGHLRPLQGASPNRLYALRYFSIPHVSKHFVELGEGRRGG